MKTIGIDTMFQPECVYRFSYAFLKNKFVDTMLNPSRKNIVRIDTMSNSWLREINGFRGRYHALVAGKH
jgi:hypothetical protein